MAGVATRILQEVILVLWFCLPEIPCRDDFGDRLARPQAGSIDVGDRVFCNPFLFFVGVENRRSITGTGVVALAIAGARVVNLEEEFEELPIADARGVKDDLDRFGVPAMIAISSVTGHCRRCSPPASTGRRRNGE